VLKTRSLKNKNRKRLHFSLHLAFTFGLSLKMALFVTDLFSVAMTMRGVLMADEYVNIHNPVRRIEQPERTAYT
jgi:hypothetical protein